MVKVPTKPLTDMAKSVVGKNLLKGFQNFNPAGFINDCVQAYSEVRREMTKRAEIEAEKQKHLAEIEANRQIFLDYLDKAFAERAENFRRLFTAVDAAMANRDNEQLGMALNSINELAKTTPFKDLIDVNRTKELLTHPEHEWKF
ncbi:MAG: hypothetical protein V1792_08205 [Pseudomonadota bacterium]